jgi:hypothetical protein
MNRTNNALFSMALAGAGFFGGTTNANAQWEVLEPSATLYISGTNDVTGALQGFVVQGKKIYGVDGISAEGLAAEVKETNAGDPYRNPFWVEQAMGTAPNRSKLRISKFTNTADLQARVAAFNAHANNTITTLSGLEGDQPVTINPAMGQVYSFSGMTEPEFKTGDQSAEVVIFDTNTFLYGGAPKLRQVIADAQSNLERVMIADASTDAPQSLALAVSAPEAKETFPPIEVEAEGPPVSDGSFAVNLDSKSPGDFGATSPDIPPHLAAPTVSHELAGSPPAAATKSVPATPTLASLTERVATLEQELAAIHAAAAKADASLRAIEERRATSSPTAFPGSAIETLPPQPVDQPPATYAPAAGNHGNSEKGESAAVVPVLPAFVAPNVTVPPAPEPEAKPATTEKPAAAAPQGWSNTAMVVFGLAATTTGVFLGRFSLARRVSRLEAIIKGNKPVARPNDGTLVSAVVAGVMAGAGGSAVAADIPPAAPTKVALVAPALRTQAPIAAANNNLYDTTITGFGIDGVAQLVMIGNGLYRTR